MKRLKKLTLILLTILIITPSLIRTCPQAYAKTINAPKLVSVTPETSTSITIKWKKVSGVTGYVIYQKKGSGEFKKINVVSNKTTSYIQTALSPAVKYTYYIRSYTKSKNGKNTYSSKSNAIYTYTKTSTPKISSITSPSKTTIKLKWNSVARADGYAIYKKIGSKYKIIATVSANKTSYTDKKLKSGNQYRYAIRAFKNVKGKIIYSAASKTASTYTKHTHKYTKKITKPTCTKTGYTKYTCFCVYSYKSNYKPAAHNYINYVCSKCNEIDKANAYSILQNWLLTYGEVDGSYLSYRLSDTTDLNYSANSDYIYISCGFFNSNGDFEFTAVYLDEFRFFSNVGDDIMLDFIEGTINPKSFTNRTPLTVYRYNETYYDNLSITRNSRERICYMLAELKEFLEEESIGITLADLGFEKF